MRIKIIPQLHFPPQYYCAALQMSIDLFKNVVHVNIIALLTLCNLVYIVIYIHLIGFNCHFSSSYFLIYRAKNVRNVSNTARRSVLDLRLDPARICPPSLLFFFKEYIYIYIVFLLYIYLIWIWFRVVFGLRFAEKKCTIENTNYTSVENLHRINNLIHLILILISFTFTNHRPCILMSIIVLRICLGNRLALL